MSLKERLQEHVDRHEYVPAILSVVERLRTGPTIWCYVRWVVVVVVDVCISES